jgi:PhnB protein
MADKVKGIPEGTHAVTPYLCVSDASKAIEFYKRVFGATESTRMQEPGGRIGHAEIIVSGATIMLSDEYPEMGVLSPKSLGGKRSPVGIHLYVEDVDAVYKRGLEAGATAIRGPEDQFYGDRAAQFTDPYGHLWYISTRKENLSAEEVEKRFKALTEQH